MSDEQIAIAIALIGFAIFYYLKFLRPLLNKNEVDVDEIDLSVSNFKRRRAEQGLCIYCGSPVEADSPPASPRHAICTKCRSEMSPDGY